MSDGCLAGSGPTGAVERLSGQLVDRIVSAPVSGAGYRTSLLLWSLRWLLWSLRGC